MIVDVTDTNHEQIVVQSVKPVLLYFTAVWCGPCKALSPAIEKMGVEYEGRAVVAKVDVDQNPGIAATYNIRGIPTILFFKNGKVVDQVVGGGSVHMILKKLEDIL